MFWQAQARRRGGYAPGPRAAINNCSSTSFCPTITLPHSATMRSQTVRRCSADANSSAVQSANGSARITTPLLLHRNQTQLPPVATTARSLSNQAVTAGPRADIQLREALPGLRIEQEYGDQRAYQESYSVSASPGRRWVCGRACRKDRAARSQTSSIGSVGIASLGIGDHHFPPGPNHPAPCPVRGWQIHFPQGFPIRKTDGDQPVARRDKGAEENRDRPRRGLCDPHRRRRARWSKPSGRRWGQQTVDARHRGCGGSPPTDAPPCPRLQAGRRPGCFPFGGIFPACAASGKIEQPDRTRAIRTGCPAVFEFGGVCRPRDSGGLTFGAELRVAAADLPCFNLDDPVPLAIGELDEHPAAERGKAGLELRGGMVPKGLVAAICRAFPTPKPPRRWWRLMPMRCSSPIER